MMTSLIPLRRLDQLFGTLLETESPATCASEACTALAPRADILEGDREFRLVLDLPGVTRADLQIEIEGETLTVSARREITPPEGFKILRGERADKVEFRRAFTLGRGVDPANITARFEDGVLTLTLAKSEQMLPRKIEVR